MPGKNLKQISRVTRFFDEKAKVKGKGTTGDKLPYEQQKVVDRIAGWEEGYKEVRPRGHGMSRAAKKRKAKRSRGQPKQEPPPQAPPPPTFAPQRSGNIVLKVKKRKNEPAATSAAPIIKKPKKSKAKRRSGLDSDLQELEELNKLSMRAFMARAKSAKEALTGKIEPQRAESKPSKAKAKVKAKVKAKTAAGKEEKKTKAEHATAAGKSQKKATLKTATTGAAAKPKQPPVAKSVKKKGPIRQLGGGLRYQDVQFGTGSEAKPGMTARLLYEGTIAETGKRFDQRKNPNNPFEFCIGAGEVIQGMDAGIVGMRVGGARKIVIPPRFGYGMQLLKKIPPNSTLLFEIKLVGL